MHWITAWTIYSQMKVITPSFSSEGLQCLFSSDSTGLCQKVKGQSLFAQINMAASLRFGKFNLKEP